MSWVLSTIGKRVKLIGSESTSLSKQKVSFSDVAEAVQYLDGFSYGYDNICNMQKALASVSPGMPYLHGKVLVQQIAQLLVSGTLQIESCERKSFSHETEFAPGIPWGVWNPSKKSTGQISAEEDQEEGPEMKPRKIFIQVPTGPDERKPDVATFNMSKSDQSGSSLGSKSLQGAAPVGDNLMKITYSGLSILSAYDLQAELENGSHYDVFTNVA